MADDRWRTVFESEHHRLFRSLLVHTGDRDLAADAEAEAFAQGLRRGEAVRDPAAWVWRSAFRIATGLLHERRHEVDEISMHRSPAALDSLPDEVIALLDALSRLPELDRRVVVLSLVGGFSAREAGAVVDMSAGAVRVRLHRARTRLRSSLAGLPLPSSPSRTEP